MCKVTPMMLALLLSLGAAAQGVFSNTTNAALKMVIEDYPNHFSNIKGDRISAYDPAVNYQSKVIVPGAVNCMLIQFNTNATYSWQCEVFASTNFQQAKDKFNELYKEIHNTIIKLAGEKPEILNGQYEAPEKDKKETTVHFHFLPNTGTIKKLQVEIQLQSANDGWKIMLQVSELEEGAAESDNMKVTVKSKH